jgi:serine/threonine-protein kinase
VVSSRLVCRPEACRVSLNRLRGKDGTVLWADSFEVPTDDFRLVVNAVAGQIQRGYSGYRQRSGGPEIDVSSEDLKTFLQLRRRFDSRTGTGLGPLLADLEALRQRSPRFLDADLLAADVARHHFNESRDPQDLARALDLVRQAEELAPDDPQPLLMQMLVALDGQDLKLAEEGLRKLETLIPGDVSLLDRRALLLRKTGQLAEAIELLRAAVRRQPSWKRLLTLARMEQQSGAIPAARRHLEILLERSPGNFEGLTQLAQIEMANGSLERAAVLYGQLVQRSPGSAQMSNLGVVYFLLGRYPAAAGIFRRVVAQEPRNPLYTLNLADADLLTGERAQAEEQYRRVVALVEQDPSAGTPQFLTVKAQALAHLGQSLPAVAAVQEASRLAPEDAGVAYESSLVYALLGENASALVNAGKALRLGFDPRWFDFPWFDSLRRQPDFQRLLPKRAEAR